MSQSAIQMTAPAAVYCERRRKLAANIGRPMVIFAGRARARQHATNVHRFRAGSSYLYFGGPPIEGAAILLEPQSDGATGCRLFRTPSTVEDAVWIGATPGDDAISDACGIPVDALASPDTLVGALGGRTAAYIAPPCPPTMEVVATSGLQPATQEELSAIIDLRLILDDHEMIAMRHAANVAVDGHLAAMRAAVPGTKEAEILATLMYVVAANNCRLSFSPIATVSGEVLHQESYSGTLELGRLLLVDAGVEEAGGYASDITRTVPVGGSFVGKQRALYETVDRAKAASIAACVPGTRYRDVHDIAARVICEGLVDAGLLRGNVDELFERGAYTLFFPHGVGHLLGLDVHDMEDFGDLAGYPTGRSRRTQFGSKFLRLDRDLQPGMVVTIEPGIYLVPAIWKSDELSGPFKDVVNRDAVEALLGDHFGGIRLEDDVHVVSGDQAGPEVLTSRLPSDADAVTSIIRGENG